MPSSRGVDPQRVSVKITPSSKERPVTNGPLLAAGLLATTLVLGGCATSRSELKLASPAPTQTTAHRANAPTAVIRTVKDDRIFEQAPGDPSTPSLGFEGALQATAEAKSRAIGRKRNTFGKALGDVFLQDGQTVESVIRENLATVLVGAGYNVRNEPAGEPPALLIDVRIGKFWAWVQPGFWAITVNTDIATDLQLSTTAIAIPVTVHVEDPRQIVTDSAWIEAVETALQVYRREVAQKLPGVK